MGKFSASLTKRLLFLLILNLGTLLSTLACPYCPYPTPPKLPPKHQPNPPPKVTPKPPLSPRKPPPSPPKPPKSPPSVPKPPVMKPPYIPKPPIVKPPTFPPPTPPMSVPNPPTPVGTPCPPPTPTVPYPAPPPEKQGQTCSIDTLKLGACVDLLGGLINVGIGSSSTKDTCCPVIEGLVDLDAAICLCTTIKAKLLNINIIVPIALQVLIDCGKTPPPDFECA